MAPGAHPEIPQLKTSFRLGDNQNPSKAKEHQEDRSFYDVKFFPFTVQGVDPVFAVAGTTNIAVCRPLPGPDDSLDVLLWIKQDDNIHSLTWSLDPTTNNPLLCVSGRSGIVKVFDAITGKHKTTLVGHGALINDLATAPFDPHVIVSASEDHTLRFWNLRPEFAKHPCVALTGGVGGTGHQAGLLCTAFHRSGKYLLSGGFDARVSLWTIPDFPTGENYHVDDTILIESPHFQTSEIHAEYIDCVQFYGDLILSKSSRENRIIIWKITGFSSKLPAPSAADAPTLADTRSETRSAFGSGYQILLSLGAPDNIFYYVRFSLFHVPSMPPILAIGNQKGRVYFWNLQKLEEQPPAQPKGVGPSAERHRGATTGSVAPALPAAATVTRGPASRSSLRDRSVTSTRSSEAESAAAQAEEERASALGNPFSPIKAHVAMNLPVKGLARNEYFCSRAVGWSQDGQWCVFAGDYGMLFLFHRGTPGEPE